MTDPSTPAPQPDSVPAPDAPTPGSPGPDVVPAPDAPSTPGPSQPVPDTPAPDVPGGPSAPESPVPGSVPGEPSSPGGVGDPLDSSYSADGVPTFDAVRERIEGRYATSVGAAELDADAETARSGRSFEEQWEERQQAGKDRLAELRKSLSER